jgi:cardiolipin synthase
MSRLAQAPGRPGRRPGSSSAPILKGLALAAAALTLTACVAEPRLPAAMALAAPAAASAARTSTGKDVARRVTVSGPRGRLNQAEREALLKRLAGQGSATLLQRQLAAMSVFGDVDLVAGNETRLLIDGPATFDAMFKSIEAAKSSVLVESYIVEDASIAQRLADVLKRKRAQGLQVALIYDAVGSFGTPASYFDTLRNAGVKVCAFNPLASARERKPQAPTERDHRKIVTIDGQVAYAGGINISGVYTSGSFGGRRRAAAPADGGSGGWRDTHVQLRGPVALRLDELVRDTWREQGCEGNALTATTAAPTPAAGADVIRVVAIQPDDDHSRLYAQLMTAFDTAQRSIHLTMAYFSPGDEMVDALCDAARRGVDVQLVLPSESDFRPVLHAGRARYQQLLDAGVQVHEFQGNVLHAKTAVIDGVWSTVGSSNLDFRSFVGNNEVNVVVLGGDFGGAMERMFQQDLASSRAITLQEWRDRPISQRLLEGAARLFERWW